MPFFIGKILEIPTTTTQDYTLFHILHDYSIDLWKRQLQLIRSQHGLASLIVHPDYIIEPRARNVYQDLLQHLSTLRTAEQWWITTPGEVNRWWRLRSQMELVRYPDGWSIEGEGKERARVAYARLSEGRITFEFDDPGADGSLAHSEGRSAGSGPGRR